MENVIEAQRPEHSLITEQSKMSGYVTDCFSIEISRAVKLSDFIEAFYKTPLFRLERVVLSLAPKGRMRDADVTALSKGLTDRIFIWEVETRHDAQILLSAGGTKSWLMVQPIEDGTRLYFGSVLVPAPSKVKDEAPKVGWLIDSLMGAHLLYSRLLLQAAARRLMRRG